MTNEGGDWECIDRRSIDPIRLIAAGICPDRVRLESAPIPFIC